MISSRSPVRAQATTAFSVLSTLLLLAVPHVAAEAVQGELAVREPTPERSGRPWQYSSFVAENDLPCCKNGTATDAGSCCSDGLYCDTSNSTPMCISIPTSTNGTNHTANHTTGSGSPTETDSGAASVAAWGLWTSVLGLTAAVGIMSL